MITATGDKNPNSQGNEIWVIGLFTQDGTLINWNKFKPGPDWEIRDNQYLIVPNEPSTLLWKSRTGGNFSLGLIASPWSGIVKIDWNGEEQIVDLYQEPGGQVFLDLPAGTLNQTNAFRSLYLFSAGVLIGFALLCLSLWLLCQKRRGQKIEKISNWLWYAVPMAVFWSVFLLAFWPGILSTDSVNQWSQVLTGNFVDAHPASHTILLWLITRVWFHPAAIALAQIVSTAVVIAWGLGKLHQAGAPSNLLWLISGIFAISPVDNVMVITLWKEFHTV